jgi:hypothetical protein
MSLDEPGYHVTYILADLTSIVRILESKCTFIMKPAYSLFEQFVFFVFDVTHTNNAKSREC